MALPDGKNNLKIQIKGGETTIPNQSWSLSLFQLIPTPPTVTALTPPPMPPSVDGWGNACLELPSLNIPGITVSPPPGLSSPVFPYYNELGNCADSMACIQFYDSFWAYAPLLLTPLTNTFPITGTGDSYLTLLEQCGPLNTTLVPAAPYPNVGTLVDIDYSTGDFTAQGEIQSWAPGFTGYGITNINYYDVGASGNYTTYATQSSGMLIDYYDYTVPTVSSPICGPTQMSAITKQEVLMGVVEAPEIQSEVFIERGKQSVFERIQRFGEISTIGGLLTYGYGFNNIKEEITNG